MTEAIILKVSEFYILSLIIPLHGLQIIRKVSKLFKKITVPTSSCYDMLLKK